MHKTKRTTEGGGVVHISDGIGTVELAPEIGGAIASYSWHSANGAIDWFRHARTEALSLSDAGELSCFPLVPYSNRIRDGRFRFDDQDIQLPVSVPEDPHLEHGHGWRNRWTILGTSPGAATMQYVHEPDEWPWRYGATQRVELRDGALCITLGLQNLSGRSMPAGLGLHPYFPATQRARIEAVVAAMWETDDQVLPTRRVAPLQGADPNEGVNVSEVELDNVFTEWSRRVRIVWPEQSRSLEIRAEAPLDFLVLYTPKGQPFFCVEPVSNATDAFNLSAGGEAGTGLTKLAPGATMTTRVEFCPTLA